MATLRWSVLGFLLAGSLAQPPGWCPQPSTTRTDAPPANCADEAPHYAASNAGNELNPVAVADGCPFTITLRKEDELFFMINRTNPNQLFKHQVSRPRRGKHLYGSDAFVLPWTTLTPGRMGDSGSTRRPSPTWPSTLGTGCRGTPRRKAVTSSGITGRRSRMAKLSGALTTSLFRCQPPPAPSMHTRKAQRR